MKKLKIAINGFGRIGRCLFREGYKEPKFDFVAINDLGKPENLVYLLKHDSIYGNFDEKIELDGTYLKIGKQKTKIFNRPNFLESKIESVDIIVEATGKANLDSLPKINKDVTILLTYPIDVPTYIFGINHKKYNGEKVISLGSCTANATIPVLYLLNQKIGIEKAFITSLNSYVAQQRLVDSVHDELRESRAAPLNIIPRTTSAIKLTKKILSNLEEKLAGTGIKLPTPCGSLMEFVVQFNKKVSKENIDEIIKDSEIPYLKLSKEALVLRDIIGSPFLLYDSELTKVIDDTAQLFVWYDNEYEYVCRVIDMLKFIGDKK